MVEVGDTIELVSMPDDPCAIPVGTKGTVRRVQHVPMGREPFTQVGVDWENGRTLNVVMPPDTIRVIT